MKPNGTAIVGSLLVAATLVLFAGQIATAAAPYQDPAYGMAMTTALKDASGTTNAEEADLDADSVVRWGLWKVRQAAGVLPPTTDLVRFELPTSGSLNYGWWIKRHTDPYTVYDEKWIHLTGSIGNKPAC